MLLIYLSIALGVVLKKTYLGTYRFSSLLSALYTYYRGIYTSLVSYIHYYRG